MKLLFIAYYFPPDSSSGSFRPMFFAKHLVRKGYKVHILTANPEYYHYEQMQDKKLLSILPKKVTITRAKIFRPKELLINLKKRIYKKRSNIYCINSHNRLKNTTSKSKINLSQKIKDTVTELLATPDIHVGWLPDCIMKGLSIFKNEDPDIIYATGGPWTGLCAGVIFKKYFKKPLVLDFRDPWVSNPSSAKRPAICRLIDRILEYIVIRNADGVIANTDELRDDFLRRYKFLFEERLYTISNGYEDYLPTSPRNNNSPLRITHTGTIYLNRNPDQLLKAIHILLNSGKIDSNDIHLQFVGGIQFEDPVTNKILSELIEHGIVRVYPRVPYALAKKFDQQADILLLLQPMFPLQIPRKLYEYMATRKRIFCISEKDSATSKMIIKNEIGYISENNVDDIQGCILRIIDDFHSNDWALINEGMLEKYKNQYLTDCLENVFKKVWGKL